MKMPFDVQAALKKFCKTCKPTTIASYARNIRRLSKIAGNDEVPSTKGWLAGDKGKALIKKIEKDLPLSAARHLYPAGSQAFRMYGGDRSSLWVIKMNEASNRYSDQRQKQQKSSKEVSNWPRDGYRSLAKAAQIIKRKISGLLTKKEYTNEQAYEVQKYIILLLFSHHAFRLQVASLYLKSSETENTLLRPRGSRKYVVTLRTHKTDKSMGILKVPLNLAVSKALTKYVPKIPSKHGYFLSLRNGNKMSQSSLSKLLIRLTTATLGKKIGVRLTRVLKTTQHAKKIKAAEELQNELGHSAQTQRTYVRKE